MVLRERDALRIICQRALALGAEDPRSCYHARMTSPLLRRLFPIPRKFAQVARATPIDLAAGLVACARAVAQGFVASVAVAATLACVAAGAAGTTACNLPPSTVNGIVHGALTFACNSVQPFIPSKDAALASTICTDATIAAGAIGDVIESVIEAPPPGVRLIHPQGDVAHKPVTCGAGVVAMVPAGVQDKAQKAMNAREECKR